MSDPEPMMTREDVARAAGVEPQAVSNWVSRHADFPPPVRTGSGTVYPAVAVADWLDNRDIPRGALRPGERQGVTFGARFRVAVGLHAPGNSREAMKVPTADLLDERLWAPVERLLHKSQAPADFEAIALSLLCLRGTDPVGWAALSSASIDLIHGAVVQTWHRQREHVANATAVLGRIPGTVWWRHQLHDLVSILAADWMPADEAFEYLLDRFAKHRHRSPDEFLIPAELARLMVRMLDPRPGSRMHDPCCGSGTLLVTAAKHVAGVTGAGASGTITGRAATARTWSLATMNLAIHGVPVDIGAGPPADPREIDADPCQFDAVLLNPPFGMKGWSLPASQSRRPWVYGEPSPHDAAFAWLQTAAEALAPGGRAAVVMPNRAVFPHTPRERNIVRNLVDRGAVRCIIDLPGHLFRETTAAVAVWILAHPGDDARPEVLLIDARAAARRDVPTHRGLTESGCRTILDAYHLWLENRDTFPTAVDGIAATTAEVPEIREQDYDLRPATYLDRRLKAVAEKRTQARLRTLPDELAQMDAAARAADLALEQCLERLMPWTP